MKRPAFTDPGGRRWFLRQMALAGIGGAALVPALIRKAAAMGTLKYPTGMQKIRGQVTINGKPAREGDPVVSGDTVATGPAGMAIFVHEKSVYLLRASSRFELLVENPGAKAGGRIEILNNIKGRVLAVFARRGRKQFLTSTAVAGIRGSAAYVESEPGKTYLCLCYGKADLAPVDNPGAAVLLETTHHEAPRYIYGPGEPEPIREAPMINHTDTELVMLEGIVHRKVPFDEMKYY
jgi:hypothetical protein